MAAAADEFDLAIQVEMNFTFTGFDFSVFAKAGRPADFFKSAGRFFLTIGGATNWAYIITL